MQYPFLASFIMYSIHLHYVLYTPAICTLSNCIMYSIHLHYVPHTPVLCSLYTCTPGRHLHINQTTICYLSCMNCLYPSILQNRTKISNFFLIPHFFVSYKSFFGRRQHHLLFYQASKFYTFTCIQ